jgi:hypothetical protein
MLNIKKLIATVLLSSVAVASFAQAPVTPKVAIPATPAAAAAATPAVAMTKHVTAKIEAPAVQEAAAVTPVTAASKPAHKPKVTHKVTPAKKADATTPDGSSAPAAK